MHVYFITHQHNGSTINEKYAIIDVSRLYNGMTKSVWDANSFPPRQNGRHFADNIFKCIFMNEKFCILIRISLKFVPKGLIDNKSALVQVMAWRRTGVLMGSLNAGHRVVVITTIPTERIMERMYTIWDVSSQWETLGGIFLPEYT